MNCIISGGKDDISKIINIFFLKINNPANSHGNRIIEYIAYEYVIN